MDNIIYLVELNVPTVTNDTGGYQTPLTAVTGNDFPTYGEKVLKFTDSMGGDSLTGYYKCISNISINLPKFNPFAGVAGRATLSISFVDFVGDPDPDSPAVQAESGILKRGTYFSKLASRQILNNKVIVVKEYNATTDTELRTFSFKVNDFNTNSGGTWVLTAKDELSSLSEDTAKFPKPFSGTVLNTPNETGTLIQVQGDYLEWSGDYAIQIGNELCTIDNVTGDSAISNITVDSRTAFVLSTGTSIRSYKKTIENINTTSAANRVAVYESKTLSYIITSILDEYDINYDPSLVTEIDTWAGTSTYGCVFVGEDAAIDVLNKICELFLIYIYSDPQDNGVVKAQAASSWKQSEVVLTEGKEITYNKGSVKFSNELRYSRVQLKFDQFDPFDESTYLKDETRYNGEYESDEFYGEEKLKELPKTPILSNSSSDAERARINAVRFLNRWALKPKEYEIEIRWKDAQTLQVGDVITILKDEIVQPDGVIADQNRAQIMSMTVSTGGVNRVSCVSYEPYEADTENHIKINKDLDVNLYIEAGAPPTGLQDSEYTFFVESFGSSKFGIRNVIGQLNQQASVISGSGWKCPVTLNLVLLDGMTITAKGGNGALGLKGESGTVNQETVGAGNGGTAVAVTGDGVRIIIWFTGVNTVQGVEYDCDGYVLAPGGGGGSGDGVIGYSPTQQGTTVYEGGNGGGGVGYPVGLSTPGATPASIAIPTKVAPIGTEGIGELIAPITGILDYSGADGGNWGEDGDDAANGTVGGLAGGAFNLGTGQIVINTNITGGRIINGNGDPAYSLNFNPPPTQTCRL